MGSEEGLTTFLEGVSLVSDIDGLEDNQGGITLITLHQAKGLEFPVVFMVGMEEGLLPHIRSMEDAEQIEEEALARTILDKLKLIGDDKGGLYLFDRDILQIKITK